MKVKMGDGAGPIYVEFRETRPRKGKTSLVHKALVATEAFLRPGPGRKEFGSGVAYTSRKDRHDPFIGRKLALQRALTAAGDAMDENDRLRIWVAFFARELEAERKSHAGNRRALAAALAGQGYLGQAEKVSPGFVWESIAPPSPGKRAAR